MWLLPSYRRPNLCHEAVLAHVRAGTSTDVVLFVDPPHDGYDFELPPNWRLYLSSTHVGMAEAMRWAFRTYPNEAYYGWLSDDLHPRTVGWDMKLIEAAGQFFMVCCNDLQLATEPSIRDGVLPGAMCWGGNLVRAVGWWALPGVNQAGIDDAWIHLAHRLFDVKRYVPDVIVEHMSYKNDKRPKDATDDWVRDGDRYIERDFETFNAWKSSLEPHLASLRIKDAMRAAGINVEGDVMEALLGPGFRSQQST